jgi:glycosyltransferase involved in cell wall biosynthesis
MGAKWLAALPIGALARRGSFDACFVHMSHEWVRRLWPVLAPKRVPILLWYAHGSVGRGLRLSHRLADRVVTSSPEGFRIPSDKAVVVGQGVDTDRYRPLAPSGRRDEVIYVGRIAPRKQIGLLVEVLAALAEARPDLPIRLKLVGPTLPGDRAYAAAVRERIAELGVADRVVWAGAVDAARIPQHYRSAFVHLNVSATGSMDKTVLESLACGCPVLTTNEAFRDLLRGHPGLFLDGDRPAAIAGRILGLYESGSPDAASLRDLVVGRHDLGGYVDRILEQLGSLAEARCASSS